jgi:hypothetical protein
LKEAEETGIEEKGLRGSPKTPPHSLNEESKAEIERVVGFIKKAIFPKIKR